MTPTNSSTSHMRQVPLSKRMVVGAGIGLLVISFFVIPAKANPAWDKLWMIQPLIVIPLAGATGGLCHYFIIRFHQQAGVPKAIAMILIAMIYIVGLWLGIVLGLNGTMWN